MRLYSLILAMAALTTIVGTASAVNLTYVGPALSGEDTGTISLNGSSEAVNIGALSFTDGVTTFSTYCADLTSFVDGSAHGYSASSTSPTGTTGIDLAGRIVAVNAGNALTADQSAGLQLAVWSAIYNGGTSFNANGAHFGVTGVSNAVIADATSYYLAANGTVGSASYYNIASGQGGQSQLAVQPAPEPACMALVVMGAIGAAKRRRKMA